LPKTSRGSIFSCFCLLVFFSLSLFAVEKNSFIYRVREAINRAKPFQVKFVQQVFDGGELEIEESGEIVFQDQQKLIWTYRQPDYKVFLLEGDRYRFYDKENEQLTIGKVKEKNEQWVWQLIFSDNLSTEITGDEGRRLIFIKNETDGLDVQIQFGQDFLPIKVIQEDPSGAQVVYSFKDYRQKIAIATDTFTLVVPAGVEIIQD